MNYLAEMPKSKANLTTYSVYIWQMWLGCLAKANWHWNATSEKPLHALFL
jgi:hypothetical protein